MKNFHLFHGQQSPAEKHAQKAISQIQKWVGKKYPLLAGSAQAKMIIECLIEVTEEKKFLSAQH